MTQEEQKRKESDHSVIEGMFLKIISKQSATEESVLKEVADLKLLFTEHKGEQKALIERYEKTEKKVDVLWDWRHVIIGGGIVIGIVATYSGVTLATIAEKLDGKIKREVQLQLSYENQRSD